MNLLMLYSSTDGHTVTIMQHMAKYLGDRATCQIHNLHDEPELSQASHQQVLIGASIRYGHFKPAMYDYIRRHKSQLEALSGSFFGVNLTARKPGKSDPDTSPYIQKFVAKSAWQPRHLGLFAGALFYPRYKFWDRQIIRLIMKITGGPTDPSTEVIYTDWQAVERFADLLLSESESGSKDQAP